MDQGYEIDIEAMQNQKKEENVDPLMDEKVKLNTQQISNMLKVAINKIHTDAKNKVPTSKSSKKNVDLDVEELEEDESQEITKDSPTKTKQ